MSMDPENKANLDKLLVELRATWMRLLQISNSAFADMEGADQPDFSISEELYVGCSNAAGELDACISKCQELSKE